MPVYIFEKPDVNIDKENSRTRDGVHMIIGIQLCHRYQSELRKMVLKDIQDNEYTELTDLPITNSWDSVWMRQYQEEAQSNYMVQISH